MLARKRPQSHTFVWLPRDNALAPVVTSNAQRTGAWRFIARPVQRKVRRHRRTSEAHHCEAGSSPDKVAVGIDVHFTAADSLQASVAQPLQRSILQCSVLFFPYHVVRGARDADEHLIS